ncbi:MAG: hypothetical protein HDS89_07555 [Bacteroidales bacterium]|nr:hypothetical protein [Bacteroidales bacterium]
MKREGSLFDEIVDLDNLLNAAYKAFRRKALVNEVRRYRSDLIANLLKLRQAMLDGTVSTGGYRHFIVREPKERQISAAPIEQRIMHYAIMNICHPIFDRQLIYDSFATRPGKGTHSAVRRLRDRVGGYRYYAKLDPNRNMHRVSAATWLTSVSPTPTVSAGAYLEVIYQ